MTDLPALPGMHNPATITDESTGVTFTRYSADRPGGEGWKTRYRLIKPDGTTFDMSISEWVAVNELADRWRAEA